MTGQSPDPIRHELRRSRYILWAPRRIGVNNWISGFPVWPQTGAFFFQASVV